MDINKFLEKLPTDQIYEDLLKPSMKKAGEALSTVIDLSNCILLPVKLLNEKSRLVFTNNMKRFEKKLEQIDKDDLTQVPEYAGIPILDKLTYLTEEYISEAFLNLLTKASSAKEMKSVHPAFLTTLNDLSSDEAKILFEIKNGRNFPFIDVYINREIENIRDPKTGTNSEPKSKVELKQLIDFTFQERQPTSIKAAWNLTGLEKQIKLNFPENIDLYINNLERNRIIEFNRKTYSKNFITEYTKLEEIYNDNINEAKAVITEQLAAPQNLFKLKVDIRRGIFEFTEYGRAFIDACMIEIKKEE